ncbi:hypothetical protein FN846DRAFT_538349 [Sphaerosporella brunnea]|uniref:Uncharacterized protein n=1 Tax=Sphaerosporella brunnea TaxID=1250544 RepID=A0A5J5EDL6_9PEZI|nr:hypothetical protein FN846DRAFT_538349 [Sphaerosporella brunnea]
MDLLATDRAPPRRWVESSRSSCHFVNKSKASSRVNKSYALPPPPPGIKDGDARSMVPASFLRETEGTGQESVRMAVEMNTASNSAMPSTLCRKRPAAAQLDSDSSGPFRSSISTSSSSTSRPTSSGRSSRSFDKPHAPSPLGAYRNLPAAQSSSSSRRRQLPRARPPQGWDRTALASPMRKLLLTMPPPMVDDKAVDPAAQVKQPQTEFYTWENLPPQSLMAACIAEFYGDRGIAKILCPIPQSEVSEMFQSIYANASPTGRGSSPGSRQVPRATNNHRLCQVLLLAATGSQYLEDSVSKEASRALFTSGKWYLDMAFGRGANDLQRLRANVLTGLFLMFEKSITAVEYLNRGIAISKARGLHHSSPPPHHHHPADAWGTPTSHPSGKPAAAPPPPPPLPPPPPPPSRNNVTVTVTGDNVAENWAHWRSIWRSLVFLEGWMFATLGSVPQTHKTFEAISEDRGRLRPAEAGVHHHHHQHPAGATFSSSSDLDFDLHAQLKQLGLLMSAITADVLSPPSVPLSTVKVYSDHLKAWHANLPSSLTLSTAIRESYESPRKNSTLLIHCAYLVSITQLTRRILVERVTTQLTAGSPPSASHSHPAEIIGGGGGGVGGGGGRGGRGALTEANTIHGEEFSKICVSAARQLATVVGMLRAENRLTKRCWLIIQSAYTAGIVICLDVARNRGRPMLESAFNESLDLISKCTSTLQHCSTLDAVAEGYLAVLRPIYLTLCTPETTATKRARMFRDPFTAGQIGEPDLSETYPSNEAMLGHIIELMKTPYCDVEATTPHGFFSEAGNPSEHYRFMYQQQQQQQQHPQHQQPQQQHQQPQQQQRQGLHAYQGNHHNHYVPASPTRARQDVIMGGTEEHPTGSPRQRHRGRGRQWTREEYEAFFGRVT